MADLSTPPAGLVFAQASDNDCAALAALAANAHINPWSAAQYRQSFASGHQGWLLRMSERLNAAEDCGDIVASCMSSQMFDEVEILDVAVNTHWRRQGLAECLLQNLLSRLPDDITRVMLEVRESNHAALGLYRKLGFSEDGRRKNYYPNPDGSREDALLMSLVR